MASSTPLETPPDAIALRILRAVRAEVIDYGLGDASVDRIAARARSSKQTIYGRYPTRLELFREALRLTIAEASYATLPDTAGLSAEEVLIRNGHWIVLGIRDPANLALYRADIVAAEHFPELSVDLHAIRSNTPHLVELMATLRVRARMSDLPAERLARWFAVLAIGGLQYLLGLPADPEADTARIAEAAHLFVHGWGGRNTDREKPISARPAIKQMVATPLAPLHTDRPSEVRWTELLRLAATQMIACGIRNTSIDALAIETGIAKMTIYRQFGSKESLVERALSHLVSDLHADATFTPKEGDPITTLSAIAKDYGRRFSRPTQLNLIRLLVGEAATRPSLVRSIWAQLMHQDHFHLSCYLETRRAAGELNFLDPDIAAQQFLLLAVHGNRQLVERPLPDEGGAGDDAYLQRIVRFFLRAESQRPNVPLELASRPTRPVLSD